MGSFLSDLFGGSEETYAWVTAMESRIKTFQSPARFKLHLNNLKDSSRLVVIVFFTYWCGPVRLADMLMRNMAHQFPDVEYIRTAVSELAKEFQVQELPTFVLLKNGKEVDRVVGAKQDELRMKIQKHRALQP